MARGLDFTGNGAGIALLSQAFGKPAVIAVRLAVRQSGWPRDGSKKCPTFFNRERKFEHLASREQFDKDCREKLKDRGANLDALEVLLNVFP